MRRRGAKRLGWAIGAVLVLGLATQPASAQGGKPDPVADFDLVKKIGTRRAYEAFLQTHPSGPYADLARQELARFPDHRRKTEPNWGDEIFIPRLMDKQRH